MVIYLAHYFTNENDLKSEIRTIKYDNGGFSFVFNSDNGVFSKNHLDFGSKLLIETIIKNDVKNKKMLDVGCGYGFIGITLSKILNNKVDMVDINKRAIHLCLMNIKENKVDAKAFESNVYENVNNKYDVIVTNPPIRAGKKIVLEILLSAKEFLNIDGELWFVIRKDQGAKSIAKELENTYNLEILEKSKGFYIFRAKMY